MKPNLSDGRNRKPYLSFVSRQSSEKLCHITRLMRLSYRNSHLLKSDCRSHRTVLISVYLSRTFFCSLQVITLPELSNSPLKTLHPSSILKTKKFKGSNHCSLRHTKFFKFLEDLNLKTIIQRVGGRN